MERHGTHLLHLLAVVAFGCATASANLVQDHDFALSDPDSGFSSHWDASSYRVTPIDNAGDVEAQFVEGAMDAGELSLVQDELGLVEGVTYEVSFDLSISVTEELVGGWESDYLWVYLGANPDPVYYWTNAGSGPVVLPPQTITVFRDAGTISSAADDKLEFRCIFDGGPEVSLDLYQLTRIAIDNVSVEPLPVPLPPGIVLAGLGMASCVAGAGMGRFRGRFRRRANLS